MSDHELGKKWIKILKSDYAPANFMDDAAAWSEDEIKRKLMEYEKAISFTEQEIENDMELQSLKEKLKETMAPYKETIKLNQAMIRYLVYVLENRGQV